MASGIFFKNERQVRREIDSLKIEIRKSSVEGVTRATNQLSSLVQDKTPVDTGNLKAAIQPIGVATVNDRIIGTVSTGGVRYAEFVEFGVGSPSNYNVPGGLRAIGAGMIRRTIDSREDQALIEKIIINSLQK